MALEEKQVEKMKQKISKIFEKEGEMGYVTLNLAETKEKITKGIGKTEAEKQEVGQCYLQILEEEKENRKKENHLFQNTEEGRREKANVLNRIHQDYWEFESRYGKIKGIVSNREKELAKWEVNLEEIENLVTNEFSLESLEQVEKFVFEKNKIAFAKITKTESNNPKFIPWKLAWGDKK